MPLPEPNAAAAHWSRVRDLFEQACGLPPDQRGAWLQSMFAGEPDAVRADVERLLRLDDRGERLEPPDAAAFSRALEVAGLADAAGQRVGEWRLVRCLGSGGMGTVWLAERADGHYEQQVALKLVAPGMDSTEVLRRFVVERQILAGLDHPGLTHLLDGGVTRDGRPFLVMQFVDGTRIDRWCDERRLGVAARVELFAVVAEAVDYAHNRGVVHRDIKPGNVLVDAGGRPTLLDFGIGKILDPQTGTGDTVTEHRLMTPGYASPEQVRGERVTPASDVYGLGVILYELLTGRRPYRAETTSRHALEQAILEQDCLPPSRAVAQQPTAGDLPDAADTASTEELAARRGERPARLQKSLGGDLDRIVLKALTKEPQHRYATAGELLSDLRRWQRGLPVQARPRTLRYRAARFLRRHPLEALAAVLLVGLAAALLSVDSLQARVRAEALLTQRQQQEAARLRAQAEASAYRDHLAQAFMAIEAGDVVRARRELELAPESLRGFEWRHASARIDRSERSLPLGMPLNAVGLAADGRRAAVGTSRGELLLVDLQSGEIMRRRAGPPTPMHDLAFSPDGSRIAGVFNRDSFAFWDAATLQRLVSWPEPGRQARTMVLDRAWSRAFCGYLDGSVEVRDAGTGARRLLLSAAGAGVQSVALDAEERQLAVGRLDGQVEVFDAADGTQLGAVNMADRIEVLAFSPSGELVAGLGGGAVVRIDPHAGAGRSVLARCSDSVMALALVPGGAKWAVASMDRALRVADPAGGDRVRVLLGHTAPVRALTWDPVAGLLWSAGEDGCLKSWLPDSDDVPRLLVAEGWFTDLAIDPRGDQVAVCTGEDAAWLGVIDLARRELVWSARGRRSEVAGCGYVDGGRAVLAAAAGGPWPAWSAREGRRLPGLGPASPPRFDADAILAFTPAPDGAAIAIGLRGGALVLIEAATGRVKKRRDDAHAHATGSVCFSPDGARLLTGGWDGAVRLWDAHSLEPIAELGNTKEGIWQVAFDSKGERAAGASWDDGVLLGPADGSAPLRRLEGHTDRVHCVAFAPDGSRLFSGGADRSVRIWDARTGEALAVLRGHPARVDKLACTPDGALLLSLDFRGNLLCWDALPTAK